MEVRVGMTFGFSLCAVSLLVVLVIYFGSELEKLSRLRPPESSKMCCCQH